MAKKFELLWSMHQSLKRHPRRVGLAVLTLLAGTAVTAFGVAPLAIEDALPTQQLVTESLPTPEHWEQTLDALDAYGQNLALYRHDTIRTTDTADTLFRRLGVDDLEAADFLRQDPTARRLLQGNAGKMVQVITEDGKLTRLIARFESDAGTLRETHFNRLTIERDAAGLHSKLELAKLATEVKVGSGTISSSLYAAADESKLPDAITSQMAELFAADIDFRHELRKGDTFTVVYETLTADGEEVSWGQHAGRVLAARFINKGETHEAIWFQEAGKKGAYYDANGRSKERSFLASPLAFSRITSGFAMRFHPVLQQWKAHLGVDYGAPIGTAVRSVGAGVVEFAGWQNGFGNVVYVKHDGEHTTVYGHLSRINVHKGERVEQGQNIALTGKTGWATGPHLHFEFRVGGKQVDPQLIAKASQSTVISAQARGRFNEFNRLAQLQLQTAMHVAEQKGTVRFE